MHNLRDAINDVGATGLSMTADTGRRFQQMEVGLLGTIKVHGTAILRIVHGVAIGTGAAAFCLVTQIVIVISRMITAMTFDRLWPAKLGYVGTKWVSPIYANFVIFLVDVVFAWVGVYYPTFTFYSGAAVLGAWLGYVVDSVAAIQFKKKMPEVYEASAVSRYEIAGRPLTEIVGWLNLIFCAFILYVYAAYWEYILGLAEFAIPGVLLVVSVYIGSAIYYMFVKWYRMNRQGIDITLAFRQIPPE